MTPFGLFLETSICSQTLLLHLALGVGFDGIVGDDKFQLGNLQSSPSAQDHAAAKPLRKQRIGNMIILSKIFEIVSSFSFLVSARDAFQVHFQSDTAKVCPQGPKWAK